ncbi:hypothetical protein QZH41_020137, partial [Actinostola sp. cb2023]
ARVTVPFKEDSLITSVGLNVICKVINETFVGWYREDTGFKIPEVAKREDAKDNLAVLVSAGSSPKEKDCNLIFPKGLPTSVGGMYTCKGKDNEAKLKIVVRFNLNKLETNQQLHFGKSGKILLGALSYPLSVFKWKKDNAAMDFSGSRLKLEKDGSIVFSKVLESDAGVYDVEINWQDRIVVPVKITVSVVEIPAFISTPKPAKLTGIKGYNYEFCFNASGLPAPKLQWYKSTVQFDTTNGRYSIVGKCIRITKLEKGDVAVYKCDATNSAGKASATVEIEKLGVTPTVTPFHHSVYSKNLGGGFKLLCVGQGDPVPTMEWSKGGNVVKGQKKKPGESNLELSGLRTEDSGNYTCTAKNNLIYKGKEVSDSKEIQLKVITKPVVNEHASDSKVYSFVGNPNKVRIRCVFFGIPKPSVNMTKGGVALGNGMKLVEYFLKTDNVNHFGDYICTAKNIHGEATYTVKLIQATIPGKPIEVSANRTCNSMTLMWKPPLSNGNMVIIHYIISSQKDGAQLHKDNVAGSRRQALINYKFKPQTTYKVHIAARNIVGSGDAEVIDVTTEKYCKPSPPSINNLGITEIGPTLVVKWDPPTDKGFDDNIRYQVAWRPKADKAQAWQLSDELKVTEYKIPNELKNGKYEIKVYAINQAGKGHPDMRVVEVKSPEDTPSTTVTSFTATPSTSFTTKSTASIAINENTAEMPQTTAEMPQTTAEIPPTIAEMPPTTAEMPQTTAEMPTLPQHLPPISGKRTSGLGKGAIAGIVIAILLLVLITIDLFCCFFNSCGVIFCCQRACCGKSYPSFEQRSSWKVNDRTPI